MALFTEAGLMMMLRWLHYFFGIIWIGHLYYFNFTQMTIMGKADNPTKSGITRVLLPEALWWFRWGAMWTMVTGVIYLSMIAHNIAHSTGINFFSTPYGLTITSGALFGLTNRVEILRQVHMRAQCVSPVIRLCRVGQASCQAEGLLFDLEIGGKRRPNSCPRKFP